MSDRRAARRWATELVVVGDGPAGSALAAAGDAAGVDTLLIGEDAGWVATYGSFVDDVEGAAVLRGRDVFARRMPSITVHAARRHVLDRAYGVVDNGALRDVLRDDLDHLKQRVVHVGQDRHRMVVTLGTGAVVEAQLVVDATGWPPASARSTGAEGLADAPAWQTAYGVVLSEPPDGDLGEPMLMDFRDVPHGPPAPSSTTFAYALPVAGGWLVEETVLAARPAVEPAALEARLAARLGRRVEDLRAAALAVEEVRIPMGAPLPDLRPRRRAGAGSAGAASSEGTSSEAVSSGAASSGPWSSGPRSAAPFGLVPFGAAAAYVHPATGYSLATSLHAAPRVAAAIAAVLHGGFGVRDRRAPAVGGARPGSAPPGASHEPWRDDADADEDAGATRHGGRGVVPGSAATGPPAPGPPASDRGPRRGARDGLGAEWEGRRGHGDPAVVLAEAVWPTSLRRTRSLHDFGLDVLLGLDADGVRRFFTTFFELDERDWTAYLRTDASPREVSAAMTRLFRSAPWSLRRRLMAGGPRRLTGLLRP